MPRRRKKVPRYLQGITPAKRAGEPKRVLADRSKQAPNNSYSMVESYEDRAFTCVDCGREEVWTAEDQKWWYEVARGPIYSRAVRCRECRARKRLGDSGTPPRSHGDRNGSTENS